MKAYDVCSAGSGRVLRLGIALLLVAAAAVAAPGITVNPSVTYQTMTGWEITDYYPFVEIPVTPTPTLLNQLFDRTVNEVGINRIRLEVRSGAESARDYYTEYKNGTISSAMWRCVRYATENDNSDPNSLNSAGFHFNDFDEKIDQVVLPLRQRVQARGEQLHVNLTYVAFVNQITASGCPTNLTYNHDDSPEEYAEFMLAVFRHMQTKYGFVPSTIEVILEPDNTPFWRGRQIGEAIVATARKLAANGFNPKFIGPSNTDMTYAVSYFNELASQVPAALPYMSEISYHRYSGVSDTALQQLGNLAAQHNIGSSMLEWWSTASSYQVLHKDLKMGRASAWQQSEIVGMNGSYYSLFTIDNSNPASPTLTLSPMTKYTRHYYQFVRRGAVRIGAQSTSSSYDPLAFRNTDGKYVVVAIANASGAFDVTGLPAGTYGVMYTSLSNASQYGIQGADVSISAGQTLNTSLPYPALVTIYMKTGGGSVPVTSGCDLNRDSRVDIADVQIETNQILGSTACTADLNGNGSCDVIDLQRIVNAALGAACRTGL